MKRVNDSMFVKEVKGGVANEDSTIMVVTKMVAVSDRLRAMMCDLSPVIEYSTLDDYDIIKVANQTGHVSYFEAAAVYFAKTRPNATVYLSNIPEPGMRYHGGHIFVKETCEKKRCGEVFKTSTWYILAPVAFETVEGHEKVQNKISEAVMPVEI